MSREIRKKNGITVEINPSWCTQDIFEQARNNGIKLSKKECGYVLDYCINDHDASVGINWEVIDNYIDMVVAEREEE